LDGPEIIFKHPPVEIVDVLALNRPGPRGVGEGKIDNVRFAELYVFIVEEDRAVEMGK
jgi:hypothetical protein